MREIDKIREREGALCRREPSVSAADGGFTPMAY